MYCFTFCAVCAYRPSSPRAMPAMRCCSVGFTVPVTRAAGAEAFSAVRFSGCAFVSHSGCAVPPRSGVVCAALCPVTMPFFPRYACALCFVCGTASCNFGFVLPVLPIICASTCPLRLPVPDSRVPAPALRFSHASVVFLVPVPLRKAAMSSAVQPRALEAVCAAERGAAVCAVAAVCAAVRLFCPLRSFSMSCAFHPIVSPRHFVPRHS